VYSSGNWSALGRQQGEASSEVTVCACQRAALGWKCDIDVGRAELGESFAPDIRRPS
jgi:hypothetical protein